MTCESTRAGGPLALHPGMQQSHPYVLLVEDHDDSREMYAEGLRHAGFAVEPAGSPDQALALLPERPVDIVVLDYSMPRMSGAQLALQLKRQSATADARYVLVTGHGPDALRKAASTIHFDAMVKKPIACDQL